MLTIGKFYNFTHYMRGGLKNNKIHTVYTDLNL